MKYVPITPDGFAGKSWSRPSSYQFAANVSVIPIAGQELASASTQMPLAFLKKGEGFQLVALMSLEPDRNLFIRPGGEWLRGTYVPILLRSHPFRLHGIPDRDKLALYVDADSELVTTDDGEHPFFDEAGKVSESVVEVMKFLSAFERNRQMTDLAVTALGEAGVIRPWNLKVKRAGVEGLAKDIYAIDETALHQLDADRFLHLRKVGALPIAYAQMLSTQLTAIFPRLEQFHENAERRGTAGVSNLSFDHLN